MGHTRLLRILRSEKNSQQPSEIPQQIRANGYQELDNPNLMKYLCIDFGIKRVGLAVSDPTGRFVFPLRTIVRTTRDKLFADLGECIAEEKIEAVLVGLPVTPQGYAREIGTTEAQVRNFIASLTRRVALPVLTCDETLSSEEAKTLMRKAGREGERKGLDAFAAAVILETYLAGLER